MSVAYYPRRPTPRPNAIAPDIDALLDAHKRNDSSLSLNPSLDDNDDEGITSLRPPPRGPKKSRPLQLERRPGSSSTSSSARSSTSSPASQSLASANRASPLPRSPRVQSPPTSASSQPSRSPPTSASSAPLRSSPNQSHLILSSSLPPPTPFFPLSSAGRSTPSPSPPSSPDYTQVLLAHTRTHSITVSPPAPEPVSRSSTHYSTASSLLEVWSLPPSSPLSPFLDSPEDDAVNVNYPGDDLHDSPEEEDITFTLTPITPPKDFIFSRPPPTPPKDNYSTPVTPITPPKPQSTPIIHPKPAMSTSMSSLSKVEQLLGREARAASPQPQPRHRPPALRSSPSPSRSRSPYPVSVARTSEDGGVSEEGRISVSSTMYPSTDRHSFIDLDDTLSPGYHRDSHHHFAAASHRDSQSTFASTYSASENVQHAMYPTPTRMAFRDAPATGHTAASDSSRFMFASNAPYQPPSPHSPAPGTQFGDPQHSRLDQSHSARHPPHSPPSPQFAPRAPNAYAPLPLYAESSLNPNPSPHARRIGRPRPVSMLVTPTPTSAFFSDPPRPAPKAPSSSSKAKPKPPLPFAPKPAALLRKAATQPQLAHPFSQTEGTLPPQANTRAPSERAEILRKHRKLAQVLGEGVGGILWPTDDPHAVVPGDGLRPPRIAGGTHRKGAHSADMRRERVREYDDEGQVLDIGPGIAGRRHSSPTSPGFGDYERMVQAEREQPGSRSRSRLTVDSDRVGSPESFMELSDEEGAREREEHEHEEEHEEQPPSPSDERKKKRDKLAKLHRFLGSRVPVELALGAGYALHEVGLPPLPVPAQPASDGEITPREERDKSWMRRRRSSSTAALPTHGYLDDRLKDELGERERVLNVKRAHKMEQMFGTRPPAKLYQTRPTASPSPTSPVSPLRWPQPPQNIPRSPPNSNPNASSYKGKGRHKPRRPGTSESGEGLLAHDAVADEARGRGMSAVYMYYRHSLNSLADIVNKDDKASLAELHQYINASGSSEDDAPAPAVGSTSPAERRRSLPARTSVQSIASTITLTPLPAPPNPAGFQERRKRAAKLTNFFGVNYRDLFGDVLESIEMGVREEVEVGALKADEVEELLGKLRKLRTRRDEISG